MMLLGIIWGFQYAMAKLVSEAGIPVIGGLFTVHEILVIAFLGYLLVRRRAFAMTWRRLGFFFAVALFGTLGELGAELLVAEHISAGELTLIISLMPVIVLLLALLLRSETLNSRVFFGLAIGGASALSIVISSTHGDSTSDVSWLLAAFLVPFTAAVALVLMTKYWPHGLDSVQVTAGILVAGTAMLAPITLWSGDPVGFNWNWDSSDWALLGFTLALAADYYIMALLARLSGAVFTSCSDFVAICAGIGWGYVFFEETPGMWAIIAACLCIAALMVVAAGTAKGYSVTRVSHQGED